MPTVVEAALLSRVKPMQTLVVIEAANRPPALRPVAVKAHGMAFANVDPDQLLQALPIPAEDFRKLFTVLCVDVCKNREELEERVAKARCLEVSTCI